MMNEGWIKLHRRLLDHPRFTDEKWLKVWLFLLCSATHKPIDRIFEGKRITLQPGQLITSRDSIVRATKVSRSAVERRLEVMKTEQQIEQQSDNRCRLITITCWDDYQQTGQQAEQQAGNKRAPSEQQAGTHKNVKNNKNEKNTSVETQAIAWSSTGGWSGITDSDRAEWAEAYPACDTGRQLASMNQWLKANPAKAHKKQWRRFVTNWLARAQERGGDAKTNGTKPAWGEGYVTKS